MKSNFLPSKTFKVITLGCRTNQYESQAYYDQLTKMGFTEARAEESVDLCIVNTCTVTASADKKSLYQIRKVKKEHPLAKIVVTGCLTERRKSPLEDLADDIFVVKNSQKEQLINLLFPDAENLPEFKIERFEAHTRAFVKVQDGCNSYCSYCTIPFVRGRSRSKPIEKIVEEVKGLVNNGYKEVVLTGINIGDYDGADSLGNTRLCHLVKKVDAVEGLERLRISSIDPDEVDNELVDAVLSCKHTCPSMHIVLQSGSNFILKRMNRKYTMQEFYKATEHLKNAHSDFTFTTDIIVGFPGETDKDFEMTLDTVERVQFSKVHYFPFSVRPFTKAARLSDPVPQEIITKRKNQLAGVALNSAYQLRENFVGQTMKVLLEGPDPERKGHIMGHTENFLSVSVPSKGLRSNDIVKVLLKSNSNECLVGERL